MAGTNDVAKNEAKGFRSSLVKRLRELQRTEKSVLVFSVPHRHHLPAWSIVNEEVTRTTRFMYKICKKFNNVTFSELSNIGKRFHTTHGLHLNELGKLYICKEIVDFSDMISQSKTNIVQPIPLEYRPLEESVSLCPIVSDVFFCFFFIIFYGQKTKV